MSNNKRPENMARIESRELAVEFIRELVGAVKTQVG